MEIDHVLIAAKDLEKTAVDFERKFGLRSLEGGRHSAWGTANRIIPLGTSYLELIAVVEPEEAAQSVFGGWVLEATPGQPIGWAARTDELEGVARRLGLEIREGSRRRPDGAVLSWRSAGVPQAAAEPFLPFFIEWGRGTPHPGAPDMDHPVGAVSLRRLHLSGDRSRLREWLGPNELPISITPGPAGVLKIDLTSERGQIVIE